MSIFRFGNYEAELDFTDVDFQEALEQAYSDLDEDIKHLPAEGKLSEVMRAQVECYDRFLCKCLGEEATESMFENRSLKKRIDAIEQLADMRAESEKALSQRLEKYTVKKPENRDQRRAGQKNYSGKNLNRNKTTAFPR